MLIYHSPQAQRLGDHLVPYLIVGKYVTDDRIDLGTGDGRVGKNRLTFYRVQSRNVGDYMAVYLSLHFYRTPAYPAHPLPYPPSLETAGGSRPRPS